MEHEWVLVSLNLLCKNMLGSQRTLSSINIDLAVRERRRASNAVKKKTTFDVLLDLFQYCIPRLMTG